MEVARYSKISEASLRRPPDAARLWRFALVIVVTCGLLACSRETHPPVPREARPQSAVTAATASPVHSGAAGADHGSWATAADSVPEALREPRAKVKSLVRAVADAAPPSTKITEFMGPRAITFNYIARPVAATKVGGFVWPRAVSIQRAAVSF